MKKLFSTKWLTAASGLLLFIALTGGVIYAQAGSGDIDVNACYDQNANGLCAGDEMELAGGGVEACLEDSSGGMLGCLPVPAEFTDRDPGSYTVYLRFVGEAAGHYPTTGRTAIDLTQGGSVQATLGAVYPIHPKGVAVHQQLNKVYVAFQGPAVSSDASKPYPFVAVIDGETDEVLYTIPGAKDGLVNPSPRTDFSGIGREPWGIAISGNGRYVFVGSFRDGLVSIIDPATDTVLTNYFAGSVFQPTAPAVNPVTGQVHFPDYRDGRIIIFSADIANPLSAAPFIVDQSGFSPFEMVVANSLQGFNFVTMRDAVPGDQGLPKPFQIRGINSAEPYGVEKQELVFEDMAGAATTGMPHAIGLWQEAGMAEPRLFITYADDPRFGGAAFPNPNKMLIYGFDPANPKNLLLRNANIQIGDYAEVGLMYDPTANLMRGTYGGFAYDASNGDEAACNNPARGGTYAVNFDGGVSSGFAPNIVAGNPPLKANNLQWKNPFEIAINPNNGKIYVTDRCWNDFPGGGKPGGGALLIFDSDWDGVEPAPEPAITPTSTDEPTPTPTPTDEPTPNPITLAMNGSANVVAGETFNVSVLAQGITEPGLYGVQFDINYNPALVTAVNLQVNPNLEFIVINNADNAAGQIRLVASRQGNAPGLTGDVILLTFDAIAANTSGEVTFTFADEKIGDSQAAPFNVTGQSYTVSIQNPPTPTPTDAPTPTPTDAPTPTPTDAPTPTPTDDPTPTPTDAPTPTPTDGPTPTPTSAMLTGQVILAGRVGNDWSGATVTVDDSGQNAVTNSAGNFTITDVSTGAHASITADAVGYLPAVCTALTVAAPETNLLTAALLSGDVNDDNAIDITDAAAVGATFGNTGPGLPADINRDGVVDIFDIILISVNFGISGSQAWTCQ